MNRCMHFGAGLTLAALAMSLPVAAQTMRREAPVDVKPARMTVTQAPEIQLDGTADRLSPGARIRDLNNMVVLSATLAGTTVPVVYRRDAAGLVHEVWILTEDEYAKVTSVGSGSDAARKVAQVLALIFGTRP
ncbi:MULTISPECIES: hypothetical protein [Ramlibacter]|uniref:Uncharacterized protein n=1 Tax=Ramlibacter aquaticus TaxID=2780094 RepID=A0ABR9SF27_9BURK|nr:MULTISPECIES: hypothetical protein [Ramlibacter]MBE7940880.1 hypothetical protein [Ramlibacter aquaticus]